MEDIAVGLGNQVMGTTPQLTFGQKLVGLTFNPSGDDKVAKAKQLCAELADLLQEEYASGQNTPLKSLLFDKAIGDILVAQMMIVKTITLKY
jgi:hypothetical protein